MDKNICILTGARPNFVKVSPLVRVIRKHSEVTCLLVYAGSEDDPTLESSLFEDLQIPHPDYYLGVTSTSLNEITSQVIGKFDQFLNEHPVDVVIVVDDLASTMAAAIVTKKRGVRLAHLVAGTRSFDINMPKEINRLVIDSLSDYLFTAGVRSTGVATREQSESSQTYMVGNILMDTLRFNHDRLKKPEILENLIGNDYILLTLNRKALLSDAEHLSEMIKVISENAGGIPIIAPLREEASNVIGKIKEQLGIEDSKLLITSPLGYLEFGWLSAHSKGVITDSGNVSEEATFNSIPCITLNDYTEHQETVSIGSNVLVGNDLAKLEESMKKMVKGEWKKCALPDRWDGRTAERIIQILLA